jgi:hypothetical protein
MVAPVDVGAFGLDICEMIGVSYVKPLVIVPTMPEIVKSADTPIPKPESVRHTIDVSLFQV